MKNILPVMISLLCITACNFEQENKQDQTAPEKERLRIEQQSYEKQYGKCESDTSVYCTKVTFEFPQLSGLDSATTKRIEAKLKSTILNQYLKDSINTGFEDYTDQFIEDYKTIQSKFDNAFGWYSKVVSKVIYSDTVNHILTIQTSTSIYTGGAHGTDEMYYVNFDLSDGDIYTLNDVFVSDFETRLNELALSNFKDQTDSANFQDFNFEENQLYNSNFGIIDEGIKFYYNPYEIAPYSSGASEIFISYEELKPILKMKLN
ncbi:DUF3298 domain-containing protein [Fulvivirga sp. RKSG066]|uniref:DUF3298 and DUF4163 domain-containing protein n=1 Tax=Fulvivirga aurantia TaxID=2529383 RepID=UPI0012BC9458|nr:DUF3298 and DUF4163 domain-containing protein [Fulvivirga aurantia]MTI19751.1 DUF3298 domain-containing protein [Fulvivirga aurantia]